MANALPASAAFWYHWGDMSQVFIGNGRARPPESLDDSGNLERVSYQDRVGQESTIASDSHPPGTGLFRFDVTALSALATARALRNTSVLNEIEARRR
jgi:hypothetical protein